MLAFTVVSCKVSCRQAFTSVILSLEKKQRSIDNCEISDSFNTHLYECAITLREMVNCSTGTNPKSNII